MKIKMKIHFYSNGKVVLYGERDKETIHEVDSNLGKYLVSQFPHWFEEIKVETKESKLETEPKEKKLKTKTK